MNIVKGALFLLGVAVSLACHSPVAAEEKKLLIVASLFPQYDFARQIAKDKATVVMLLPPGVESHAFDPRPGDVKMLHDADLFIFTGEIMEPWAERIVQSLSARRLLVVDASSGMRLRQIHEHDPNSHHTHEYDPHVWLDLSLAEIMVDNIAKGLCEKDPAHTQFYEKNASDYKTRLRELDNNFGDIVDHGDRDTLVFGGRFAYLYFLEHYKLKYVTAYDSCSFENEPSVRKIADVIRYMRESGTRFIFHEEFADPRVARSIAEQTGAELLLFSTAHNVSKDDFEAGITFVDVMESNMSNLKKALVF